MLFSVAGQTIEAIFLPGWILVDIVGQKTGYKQKFKRMVSTLHGPDMARCRVVNHPISTDTLWKNLYSEGERRGAMDFDERKIGSGSVWVS
jgi:hypothetical protein